MEDEALPCEAVGLPVQGPHRRGGEPPRNRPLLRLIMEPTGLFVDLTRSELVLGRHSEADVRVPLPDVSRRHCRFTCRDGAWWVVDLNSLNGVYVNDERVPQAQLHENDQVRVGGFAFRVHFPPEGTASAEDVASRSVLRSIADALPEPSQRLAS